MHPEDYDALASLRYALRKFLSFSKRALAAEADLTPEQYEALLALKAFSGDGGFTFFVRLIAAGSRVLAKVAVIHRREMRTRSPEMIEALLRLRK